MQADDGATNAAASFQQILDSLYFPAPAGDA
jgi:hypothetical protein